MLVSFENIPSHARVWVYQAERNLNESEAAFTTEALEKFVSQWSSHGVEVNGSVKIFYDRFIVLASDEQANGVSGCSIDKSVNTLQTIGQQIRINLIDRKVAYLYQNEVVVAELKEVKELISSGRITPETLVFNPIINSKADLETQWQVPADKSWLGRYFEKVS